MHPQQKEAAVILALAALSVLLFLVLNLGFEVAPHRAFASFGLFALAGFLPLLRYKTKVVMDERDQEIARQAALAGFAVFYATFVAGALYVYFSMGCHGCIPVTWATNAVIAAMILVFTVRAVVQLILYRTGTRWKIRS